MRLYRDSELCRLIYVDNFEAQERQFVNMFLRPGDIFVDIGANIGLFTLIAAQRVGKTGKVYSFEPGIKAFERLQINVQLNQVSNTCCYQIALSDRSGKAVMYIANDNRDAWNSLSKPLSSESAFIENIETITFDEFVEKNQLTGKVTMVKIDVEGWESHVLSGGVGTFSRPDAPVLQVEFTEENARQAGTSCRNLYEQLVGLGYTLFTYDKQSNSLIRSVVRDYYVYSNLIACKNQEYITTRLRNMRYSKQW